MTNPLRLGSVLSVPLAKSLACSKVATAISRHRKIKMLQA